MQFAINISKSKLPKLAEISFRLNRKIRNFFSQNLTPRGLMSIFEDLLNFCPFIVNFQAYLGFLLPLKTYVPTDALQFYLKLTLLIRCMYLIKKLV